MSVVCCQWSVVFVFLSVVIYLLSKDSRQTTMGILEKEMTGTTDMNIVLGQGNAIKEVHNIRKQSLELNQQFIAQKTEDEKKEDKSKIKKFDTGNRIEVKADEEKKGGSEDNRKDSKKERTKEESNLSEGNLIDITV